MTTQPQTKNTPPTEMPTLMQLGLSEKETEIYQLMLKHGKIPASKILPETDMKRTTVYSILEDLTKKGLLEKDESGAIIKFRAKHPYALKEFLEGKVEQIKTAESKLDAVLPNFISLFNEAQNRPGVKFYEGKEGVWKVMAQTLNSKTEILAITDVDAVDKYINELNQKYAKLRDKKEIKKRILVIDSPLARKRYVGRKAGLTEVRFVDLEMKNFNATIQIFDNKIGYVTMTDKYLNSIIINDQHLYNMQKTFFEFMWAKSQAASA